MQRTRTTEVPTKIRAVKHGPGFALGFNVTFYPGTRMASWVLSLFTHHLVLYTRWWL